MNMKHVLHGDEILQIGYGRLGKPFYKYLSSQVEGSPVLIKNSDQAPTRSKTQKKYKYIFLCTNDSSLQTLINEYKNHTKFLIHFSGSFYSEHAVGAHPVFSFPHGAVDIDFSKIEYVLDKKIPSNHLLNNLFKAKNYINPERKKDYHLHLSLLANYTQLLSYLMGESFTTRTGLSEKLLLGITKQSIESVEKSGEKSFSGPWTRDERTDQDNFAKKYDSKLVQDLNKKFSDLIKTYKEGIYENT